MYNKLFTKILDSSVWLAPDPHRLVWITLIAAMDEDGNAMFACSKNLAARARVTLEQADEAIKAFESPDLDSGDPENEGRRIERFPGGWHVLNAHKYRAAVSKAISREQTRIRTAQWRQKKKDVTQSDASVTRRDEPVTPSEAVSEAEAISESRSRKKPMSATQTAVESPESRVFEFWRSTYNHPKAKLDRKRQKVLQEALKNYSESDLCLAIRGYQNSPHHMGRNDRNTVYDDLEIFLRDAKHIDAGIKFAQSPQRSDLSAQTKRIIDQTADWVPPEMRRAAE